MPGHDEIIHGADMWHYLDTIPDRGHIAILIHKLDSPGLTQNIKN